MAKLAVPHQVMMGDCSEEVEERFFDTREEITSVSDLGSDCSEDYCSCSGIVESNFRSQYELWIRNPESVDRRRSTFMKVMGLSSNRIMENSGAVLRNSYFNDLGSSTGSSISSWLNEAPELLENVGFEDNRARKLDDLHYETRSNSVDTFEEFRRSPRSTPLVHQFLGREVVEEARKPANLKSKSKRGWLSRLGVTACIADMQGQEGFESTDNEPSFGAKTRIVRVNHYRWKRSKELSSVYTGQEFQAHTGSITAMKFSQDGQHLASACEDGIVRVWKVIEEEGENEYYIPEIDPSSLYFAVKRGSKLTHLDLAKEKMVKTKRMNKSSESACVIFPPKVFRILEKPLHEFHGHSGEVLDLAWSKNGNLLSSSVDKSVRLWKVGCDECLRVFSHNDYVTCIDFNPLDDNYFISGSIDGKVRIWEVLQCRVVDWIYVRDIVTAVCYRPDAKGGIVGSMTGNCRFYTITDSHLQLDSQKSLQGKKKLPCKRITGFQFSPNDQSKIMVTTADSQVRILSGEDVVCKFKGIGNAGNHSATFTSDGKHIVSATEDCSINIWNYKNQEKTTHSKPKKIYSHESFVSHNATIAIPWCGMQTTSGALKSPQSPGYLLRKSFENGREFEHRVPISSPDCLSLSRGFFLESLQRGTATWPEEKLAKSSPPPSAIGKSEYKFLKSACQNTITSPHLWGLIIVTAGFDGWIRTYHNYGLPIRL